MNCRKCGNFLNDNETYCHICGEPVNLPPVNETNINQAYNNQINNNYPVYPSQPTPIVNQNYNQPPTPQIPNQTQETPKKVKKKSSKLKKVIKILLILLLLILIGAGGFIAYKKIEINPPKEEQNNEPSKNENKEDKKDDSENKNSEPENPEEPGNFENNLTITIDDYLFTLPTNLTYTNTENKISATDNTESPNMLFNLFVNKYSYETAKNSVSVIITELTEKDFIVESHGILTYENREYYCYVITYKEITSVYFISSLANDKVVEGYIIGQTEEDIDKSFTNLSFILDKVSQIETNNQLPNRAPYSNLLGLENLKEETLKGVSYNLK